MLEDTEKLEHEALLADKKVPSIGGTTAAILTLEAAGETPPFGKSAFDEWARLTGKATGLEDNDRLEMGRLMEGPVATRFTRKTGIQLVKVPKLVHPDYSWATGNMDRGSIEHDPDSDVEIKTVEYDRRGEWSDPNVGEAQRVPPAYFLQAVWYAGIHRYRDYLDFAHTLMTADVRKRLMLPEPKVLEPFTRRIYIAAQHGLSQPLRIYQWEPDNVIKTIWARMFETSQKFWEENVLKDVPPPMPAGNVDAAKRWLRHVYPAIAKGDLIDGGAKLVELARAYKEAAAQVDKSKKEKDRLSVEIAALIGKAEGGTGSANGYSVNVKMVEVKEMEVKASIRAAYRFPKITVVGETTEEEK